MTGATKGTADGSKKQQTPAGSTSDPEMVVRNGDAILQLGADDATQQRLLVSSVVLSISSPVFQAMFDGRFREGQALSSASPIVITLSDDDPNAGGIVLRLVHMQTSTIPSIPDPNLFAQVARFGNKYACIQALRPWALVWTADLLKDPGRAGFENVLIATYLLDLPQQFADATRAFPRGRDGPLDLKAAANMLEILPMDLLGSIIQMHRAWQIKAADTMGAAFKSFPGCRPSREAVRSFFFDLWQVHGHLPGMSSVHTLDLSLAGQSDIPARKYCGEPLCTCYGLGGLKNYVHKAIKAVYEQVPGICLDCAKIRVGSKPNSEVMCRLSHTDSNLVSD